ncbi:MAG TPA: hypothetical protein VF093_00070 [Solirubrobacterales bacterium]
MRSARRGTTWLALLVACGLLSLGALPGCATTQQTAAKKQAESKRILEARERRQEKRSKSDQQEGKQR